MDDLLELVFGFEGAVPKISEDAFVAPTSQIIGDVEIGPQASVWYGCVLRGDVNRILIGARSNLQDGTIVHGSPGIGPTDVGAGVLVGHGALIHGCRLCDGSFVGMRAVVLNNAVVETGALRPAAADTMRASVDAYVDLGRRHKAALLAQRGAGPQAIARSKTDGTTS
jgi:carbonic anhydrase/acetyltransferase-like protein (isoleucine patch superfamily)